MAGNRETGRKAHFLRNFLIKLFYLAVIAIEQLQETCLRARGALGAEQLHLRKLEFKRFKIKQQIFQPQGSALADGGRLSGLEVSKGEAGQVFIRQRKLRELIHEVHKLFVNQTQALGHCDDIRIVAHIAGCGA